MKNPLFNKAYDPHGVEKRWYGWWESQGFFHADETREGRNPYSIVIPPPNITGSLHLGHALNNTLQDILIRWRRMRGDTALWLPGTDHAGIATQNVVERKLHESGTDRDQLGRAEFIKRVWKWREEFGRTIISQLKRLGASCDWERERFTMDEGLSTAVREVFVQLYDEGLIYRGERLINWCPRCLTALSDIEVEHEETQGKMYYLKYPLADEPDRFLTVATTRPETLLGDVAVAVHPEDPRYNNYIGGKKVRLPLTNRDIPIVGDSILVDREFGTGAVKITPAHDFNDEKAGHRHGLSKISILDKKARIKPLSEDVDPEVRSSLSKMGVVEARGKVVEFLEKRGQLVKIENHRHALGKCYRCKTVVEPFDSSQWFVRMNDPENSLAQPAIDAVRDNDIKIVPGGWKNSYLGWMGQIEDWCISRQIWWGHQIPVWYCTSCNRGPLLQAAPDGTPLIAAGAKPIVARSTPARCPSCGGKEFVQDPDVLDTWFSSALWPFSTLGWPEKTVDLKMFYPTSTLVTSFDILFFWVARMIMMGIKFMKQIPFREVYIHALVRDAEGQKMSKSKGNVIDPLGVMEKYGTDALRFTLASMASPGRDIKLSEERIEGYRNFANKIWNAARFVLMNLNGEAMASSTENQSLADHWVRIKLNQCIERVNAGLEDYRFDVAAHHLYRFIWYEFCDWYLELVKPRLSGQSTAQAEATRAVMVKTIETTMRLLHPFMPFISEEIWQELPHAGSSVVTANFPVAERLSAEDQAREGIMNDIIGIITALRSFRSILGIPARQELNAGVQVNTEEEAEMIIHHAESDIKRLARVSGLAIGTAIASPKECYEQTISAGKVYIDLKGIDLNKAEANLKRAIATKEAESKKIEAKRKNPSFRERAPSEVVAENDRRRNELNGEIFNLSETYRQINRMLDERGP